RLSQSRPTLPHHTCMRIWISRKAPTVAYRKRSAPVKVSIPNIQKSLVDQISADGNNRHAAVSALAKAATVVVAAVVKADSASALAQVPRNKVMISSPPSSHVVVTGLGVATVR